MKIPETWKRLMEKQCEFVACSMVNETKACEFGDNDEGKILDLEGGEICHYRYLLQLCSLVLGKRYESFEHLSETISWLYSETEIETSKQLPLWKSSQSRTFEEGGYTFLRSKNGKIVIGIDHAPLGFGSIAAHGHADALSFQLYVDGNCILGDPGTYIYHCNIQKRDEYRRSCNHNTVWSMNQEQSQMMGAFLWGKKADAKLLKSDLMENQDFLLAECVWQNGNKHSRSFCFNKADKLVIEDDMATTSDSYATLVLHPACQVKVENGKAVIQRGAITVCIETNIEPTIEKCWYSEEYGKENETHKLCYPLNDNKLKTTIWIEKY